jgi:NADH:ubiquinone oxidoreductase subunit 4 (subunit M)
MPILGLHFWLPKAHVEARTRGSIILAGLLLKLGRFGIFFIVSVFKLLSLRKILTLWLLATLIRRIVTCTQSDLKKLVAYRRVRHITIIIVGLSSGSIPLFISLTILSLAHGWASIGIFLRVGLVRHVTHSRINIIVFSTSKIRLFRLLLGGMLILNASIPPIPSFFPEITLLLRSIKIVSPIVVLLLFTRVRVLVCYFNCLVFIRMGQVSPIENMSSTHLIVELKVLLIFSTLTIITLL